MRDEGLCAQIGGDFWFPEKGDGSTVAKAMCLRCPIREKCLDYALANDEQYGIWGGMTLSERRKERRRRGRLGSNPRQPVIVPQRESQRRLKPFGEHGTPGGSREHSRRGEKPCEACRQAYNRSRPSRRRSA